MTATENIWIPEGADRDAWLALVADARECVEDFIRHTVELNPKAYYALTTEDGWEQDYRRDDWALSFANYVLDAHPYPDDLHPSLLKIGTRWAEEHGSIEDDYTDEDKAYAAADRLWHEAVDTAEIELSREADA